MAPARPMTAEPKMKTRKCCHVTSFPMAAAAVSLSRIARIIRPQGDFSAVSENHNNTPMTAINKSA